MSGDREKYLEQGLSGYVSKPINKEELYSTIAKLITKNETPSES